MKKLLLLLTITYSLFVISAPFSLAHATGKDWGGCTEKILDASGKESQVATLRCIPVVFGNVVSALLAFVGAVSAFMLVYAGIQFVTSGGDPKKVQGARQIVTYALIGLVIVLSSFAIIYFISYTTGVKCITTIGFTC